MSEPEEDFAAMFEASVQARRFERGQTIEGTIVAIGPEVAFVNVGGKGEAQIDIAELKDDDGDVEVAVGDRIQAMVVSTSGGMTLSRRGVRGAATQRQLEDAFRAGLPVEGKVEKRRQGRIRGAHRPPARLLPALADRHRPHRRSGGARRASSTRSGSSNTRKAARTSSSRGARFSRRSSRRARRPCAKSIVAGAVLTGPRRLGARFRRVRRPGRRRAGPAPRLGDGLVARRPVPRGRRARRRDHGQGAARRRGDGEDLPRAEAADRRSVDHGRRRPTRWARCGPAA